VNEYVKAIKVIHQLLILTSAAIVAFALAPNLTPQFDRADLLLRTLQEEYDEESWKNYVYELQHANQEKEDRYLNELMKKMDPSFHRQEFPIFMYTDLSYPLNGTLSDLRRLSERKQTLQLVSLKRDEATLVGVWRSVAAIQRGPGNDQATLFYPKISGLNVIPPGGSYQGGPLERFRIVPLEQQTSDRSTRLSISLDPDSAPNHVDIELTTLCIFEPPTHEWYVRNWLCDRDVHHILFSEPRSGSFLTSLDPFWEEVSGVSISQAREKLRSMREAQHGKVSLFGLSVDPNSTVQVMPWVVCGLLIFLTAHIRQARKSVDKIPSESVAWVGIFGDWTGLAVTVFTIPILPWVSCFILVKKYGIIFRLNSQTISLAVIAILSLWTFVELILLRGHLWCLKRKVRSFGPV